MDELELEEQQEELQTVVFRLEEEFYGIEIFRVNEIIRMRDITPVPGVDHHIEGLINLRGKTIPVVDLRRKLHMEAQEPTGSTRIIVVEAAQEHVGVIVDEVTEVMSVTAEETADRPEIVRQPETDYALRLAKKDDLIITLLDLDRALAA